MNSFKMKQIGAMLLVLVMIFSLLGGNETSVNAADNKLAKSVTLKIGKKNVTNKTYRMQKGESGTIKVSVKPESSMKSVLFTSSNKGIVEVSKKGKLTAKKLGTAKITVTVTDKKGLQKKSWVKVKVEENKNTVEEDKTNSSNNTTEDSTSDKNSSDDNGSGNNGSGNNGSGDNGSGNSGSGNNGSENNGSGNNGSGSSTEDDGQQNDVSLSGSIYVDDLENNLIQTDEESFILSGTVSSDKEIIKISCEMKSAANEGKKYITVEGTSKWKTASIPLDIGANYIQIAAYNNNSEKVIKEITIIRNSTYVNAADNVVAFDVEDKNVVKDTYNSIITSWMDDNGTDDVNDDIINIVVTNENPIYQNVINGKIKRGDVIYMPANDYFLTGFTYVYENHDDEINGHLDGYSISDNEVIHLKNASIIDLFADDISINSTQIDQDNPIAFVYNPYEEANENELVMMSTYSVNADQGSGNNGSGNNGSGNNGSGNNGSGNNGSGNNGSGNNGSGNSNNKSFNFGAADDVKYKGFQPQNLAKIMAGLDVSQINNGKIQMVFPDMILYDKDGNKDTEYDRVCINGNKTISELKPTIGVEWHPSLVEPLPKQLISTLEYKETNSIKVTMGGDLGSLGDLVNEFNDGFENKQEAIFGHNYV